MTNGLQDVALTFEPGEPDVLKRQPRARDDGIISRLLRQRSVITGLVLAIGTLGMFWWELNRSDSLVQAQSVALTTLVLFQMLHVFNARSDYRLILQVSPISNPFLLLAVVAAFIVHVVALYFPPAQFILRVEPISAQAWFGIIAVALLVIVVVEIDKLIRRRIA